MWGEWCLGPTHMVLGKRMGTPQNPPTWYAHTPDNTGTIVYINHCGVGYTGRGIWRVFGGPEVISLPQECSQHKMSPHL